MITLLTAFFLMLYSMSVMSKGKFSQMATSVRGSFTGITKGGAKILPNGSAPVNQLGLAQSEYIKYTQAMRKLNKFVEQHKLTGEVSTRSDERGVVISLLSDKTLFERGKSDLRGDSSTLLDHVGQILQSVPNSIAIEGHTCDLPIHTAQFPSNWELSTARAGTILRYYTDQQGMPGRRFMAAGYADTRPLGPNSSEANRGRNRRVDIVILKSQAQRAVDAVQQAEIRRITVGGLANASDTESLPSGGAGTLPAAGTTPLSPEQNGNHGRQGDSVQEP